MRPGLTRFGRPQAPVCNLGLTGTLPAHTAGSAYSATLNVTNRVGDVTAELVSATPTLPAGWTLSVNQATGVVTLAWPASAPSGALANLGFESGSDTNWLLGNGWVIDSAALVETGTQSAKYNGPGQSSLRHAQAVPVTPGTTITASARISKGTNRQDYAGGAVVLEWLTAAGAPLSFAVGNVVNTGTSAFQTSTVTATAPAGAGLVRLAVSGTRDIKGRATDRVYVDNASWNHSYAIGGGAASAYAVTIRVRDGRGCTAQTTQTIGSAGTVVALMHFDGTNGSTSFPDDTGRIWTATGGAQVSTAQSRFGGASALFNGAGQFIDTASSAGLTIGSGDFCIEFFMYYTGPTSVGAGVYDTMLILTDGTNRVELRLADGGFGFANSLQANVNLGSTLGDVVQAANANRSNLNGRWAHVAFTQQSGACRLFVDGVNEQDRPAPVTISGASSIRLGGLTNGTQNYRGHIDEMRITRGSAVYTANFTPPTAPFTL